MGLLETGLGSRARALRVAQWVFRESDPRSAPPEALPGVNRAAWNVFREHWPLPSVQMIESNPSPIDRTTKYIIAFGSIAVETVLIQNATRSTVCISSQAGCSRHCAFCATAKLGLKRNLTADEMVCQYLIASRYAPLHAPARNVVFMGMGEPMDNLESVLETVTVLCQSPSPQLAASQVTVSTSGIVPSLVKFLRCSKASLALSLNATTDAQRDWLMPQNRQWPIASLIAALREDQVVHPRRIYFIEYVMFRGFNDQIEDANRLVKLLMGLTARVNLIPYNPGSCKQLNLSPPQNDQVTAFQHRVQKQGIRCMVRWPRGGDIAAACGQLALRSAQEQRA